MLFSNKHQIRLACIAVLSFFFTSGVFAQTDVNQVVKAQNAGSDLYITIDHSALRLFNDSTIARLNPDGDGEWNTWKDVLTNGNSPGMDVNFDSNAAYGLTNVDGSGDLTMGTVTMTGFSVDADGDVVSKSLDNSSGGITNAGAISGATTVTASGTITGGTLTVAGAIDANNDLDLDGTDVDVDATNDISLDAGAASNFSTSAGALTLAGAGGVTVTSTGGTMALNGAGQTVDLDAGTLDIDASLGLDVDVPSGQDLFLTGGQIHLISNEDVYRGIYLKTNAGTNETIDLRNVQGTGAQAIQLKSLVGSVDIDAGVNLTMDADGGSVSIDAAAASNLTTSAGALTLEGAGGVTVTSTGGTLLLNGTGQTVDLDAATLDIDATTITVDATTTTFTGKVEGPNATADNQFTTYYQLDSLANRAPFNETLRRFRLGTSQSITTAAGATRVALSGPGIYTESSDPVENPVDPLNPPMSVQSTGGQHIDLSDPGIYQVMLTMELSNSNVSDALALVEIYNYDASQLVFPTLRVLAADTEEVYGTGNAFTGVNSHLNLSMTFEADNSNEDIYIQITTYGANIDIEGYGFTVSRIGEQ